MSCPRCTADPQPEHFGDPRGCAFDEDGHFTPHNWNCATIAALLRVEGVCERIHGESQTVDLVPAYVTDDPGYHNGWIALSRYKQRGRCSSVIHIGDFWPPREVRLSDIEAVIEAAKGVR